MDFKDVIRQLGERVAKMKEQTLTEEATKTALIMPFLQSLDYDVFNPSEVVPEFDADIPGLRRGEKVDYAVLKDGSPKILIECKHWKQKLDFHDGQLIRYFHVTKAKFAILTNGVIYRFFTDLFEPNKMDEKPFLEFDITKISEPQIEALKLFHKSYFDEANITSAAIELIYTNGIKQRLIEDLKGSPSEDFVKYLASKTTYPGRLTQNVLSWFSDLVKRSSQQVLNDLINERLTSAMNQPSQDIEATESKESKVLEEEKSLVETTTEEMEGFYIVKAICRQVVDSNRIAHRDAQTYFAILLDDNNRKPICRLHLNKTKKHLETFEIKGGQKREIASIDDIYKYSAEILQTLNGYIAD